MLNIVIGLIVVTIGATVASWIFDSKTADEKVRQEVLSKELRELQEKFDLEISNNNANFYEISKNNYEKIKAKFLKEVIFFREEKKYIKADLDKLASAINVELKNESISAYQRQSLLDNRNKVEDAKNRLDAYWLYLDWFEKKLEDLAKYKKYDQVFDLELPQPLLPEDYLYLGKLASINKIEDEIATDILVKSQGWNCYGQNLSLKKIRTDQNNYLVDQNEMTLYEQFEDTEEFYILIDNKSKSGRFFQASIAKGLIYRDIINDMSLEVKPVFNERPNQEKLILVYNNVYLNLKREEKLYPFKKYKENDNFEVKIKEYDLLLQEVYVTEKITQSLLMQTTKLIPIIFSEDLLDKIISIEDKVLKNDFQVCNLDKSSLILKVDNYELFVDIDGNNKILLLKEIRKAGLSKVNSSSFTVPYKIQLIHEKTYYDTYKNLIIDIKTSFVEFLTFINDQFNYISYSSDTRNNDFEVYKKWQRIIDYQIEDNSYEEVELEYSSFFIKDNEIIFNVLDLKAFESNIKDKRVYDVTVEVGGINIGLLDDYSLDKNLIKTRVGFSDNLNILSGGLLYLRIKTYQTVLHKQKKALRDFSSSKMVNADLKQVLVSPQLISYKPISENSEINFKNHNFTENQKNIVKSILNVQDIFLIQGPPGTGKTTVIKEIIFQTISEDNSANILIVSQQNVAVDNVLSGIYTENKELFDEEEHTIVRVAPNEDKVQYDEIKKFTVERWFERYKEEVRRKFATTFLEDSYDKFFLAKEWLDIIYKEDFRDVDNEVKNLLISKHQILGATCVGLANKSLGLDLAEFDLVIVDEAGRATLPELLIPILRAKKVILIGDHNQLPPSIDRKLLNKLEEDDEDALSANDMSVLEKSYFEELYEKTSDSNKAMLTEQFRMPKEIGDMISRLFYDNKLRNGYIKNTEKFLDPEYIIQWIDIANSTHSVQGTSSYNTNEINQIIKYLELCNTLLESRGIKKTVGIITPYSAQKNKLRQKANSLNLTNISNLKIDTVDSFQGEQADIIIYSTVKTYGNISFLIDRKRLNVAMSRTKENLVFVGSKDFFYNKRVNSGEVNLFKEIIDTIG